MAPKRPLGNPPLVSSSNEDDEESSSDEEIVEKREEELEEEEEEEEEEVDEKEEEGSSTDSDGALPSPNISDFKIKPTVHKSVKPKKTAPELTTPISKKRVAETPKSPETSKKKMKGPAPSGGGDEDEKKVAFQRIWSDEDVIAILEGMIALKEEKGADPLADMAGFCDYMKDAIHISVSKSQMSDKIRGLKKKYQNNAKRGKDGKDPVFSKPHDSKTFQLSKLIWGGAVTSNGSIAGKSNNKSKASASEPEKSVEVLLAAKVHANADEFWTSYPSLHKSIELLPPGLRSSSKDVMRLVSPSKVKEMDEKWQKFNNKEYDLNMKKAQLFLDVSRAIGFGEGN